jgi:aminoglycoside phosphotransferase (APT) family kinase protein
MPLLGSTLFKGMSSEAERLSNDFRLSNIVPSFIHGDFVFKNIHIKDERAGLIDFANANSLSHPLNDIYNLRFALANMLLPKKFKADLFAGFQDGLGSRDFTEIAQRFYYEYHRRRWLMLKLTSRNPADLIQGFRGLLSFAKPFTAEDKAV